MEGVLMGSKLFLVTDDLELIVAVREYFDQKAPESLELEVFSNQSWADNLETPHLRSKILGRPVLLAGIGAPFFDPSMEAENQLPAKESKERKKYTRREYVNDLYDVNQNNHNLDGHENGNPHDNLDEPSHVDYNSSEGNYNNPNNVVTLNLQKPQNYQNGHNPQNSQKVYPSQMYSMEEIEKQAILNAIEVCRGNLSYAAKSLRLGRATLYRKLKQYGIDPHQIKEQSRAKMNPKIKVA